MPARYHLRFQLHPTPQAARQAEELAKFCTQARVDEVVLLLGAEEFHTGRQGGQAEELAFETAASATKILREAGLSVSLNPWVTVGHADRGRTDTLGFAPMVDPDGRVATAQASFACPNWRAWLAAQYARYATLDLRVLWLEDDFRYHNHAPLHWGGGFEPVMLERFAAAAGLPVVTREELVATVTAPGTPHPWRALLQQVWRTAQLEVAAEVAAAVGEQGGTRVQLGLMSSELGVHSVEGRDWPALFEALSINGKVAHRPHFARYGDAPGRELSFSLWMLEAQRALRPQHATSEPEIENWPHTAWSKSDTQTWSELLCAQLAGSDAMFLNVHPMQSGHAQRFPRIADLLRRSRPALDWVADHRPRTASTHGVGLPMPQHAAAHVRTLAGGKLAALAVDAGPAADYLLRYGVPVTADEAPVQAVFGQLAWSFEDFEVERMLSGGLLLDGAAAEVLTRRGFGHLLGITGCELIEREPVEGELVEGELVEGGALGPADPYALEYVTGEHLAGEHLAGEDVHLSVNVQPALARFTLSPGADTWTTILTSTQHAWGPGRFVFHNELGGRVAVLAATAPNLLPYDDDGQRLLHAMVRFLEGEEPTLPLVSGGPHLLPHLSHSERGWLLAVANGSADPARPRIALPTAPTAPGATLLTPLTPPISARIEKHHRGLTLVQDLPHRGWLILDWH
ncbi:hypothetical protein [Kitasatospora kifunensis]|uniref:Uncharacterized protein n=1 Tax=Kitasatospora kifunensis TaxID=58351 RepID=A0A7W7VYH2_KITKI|nr:hypothetical protein [Kitasatospora kifunensis]MBB4927687.1 hypothetical protein [Kitasatospora kifunensis]